MEIEDCQWDSRQGASLLWTRSCEICLGLGVWRRRANSETLGLEMSYIQNKGSPQGNQKPAAGLRPRNLKQKHEKSFVARGFTRDLEQIDMEEFSFSRR
jgi:hypothetical protein